MAELNRITKERARIIEFDPFFKPKAGSSSETIAALAEETAQAVEDANANTLDQPENLRLYLADLLCEVYAAGRSRRKPIHPYAA